MIFFLNKKIIKSKKYVNEVAKICEDSLIKISNEMLFQKLNKIKKKYLFLVPWTDNPEILSFFFIVFVNF